MVRMEQFGVVSDSLVVTAELSGQNSARKCSREVWGTSETHFSGDHFLRKFPKLNGQFEN